MTRDVDVIDAISIRKKIDALCVSADVGNRIGHDLQDLIIRPAPDDVPHTWLLQYRVQDPSGTITHDTIGALTHQQAIDLAARLDHSPWMFGTRKSAVAGAVAQDGFCCVHHQGAGRVPCSSSVGIPESFGLPNFIMLGVEPEKCSMIMESSLDSLLLMSARDRVKLLDPHSGGTRVKGVIQRMDVGMSMYRHNRDASKGDVLTFLLIQVPDPAGLLPDDPGCDPAFVAAQDPGLIMG